MKLTFFFLLEILKGTLNDEEIGKRTTDNSKFHSVVHSRLFYRLQDTTVFNSPFLTCVERRVAFGRPPPFRFFREQRKNGVAMLAAVFCRFFCIAFHTSLPLFKRVLTRGAQWRPNYFTTFLVQKLFTKIIFIKTGCFDLS